MSLLLLVADTIIIIIIIIIIITAATHVSTPPRLHSLHAPHTSTQLTLAHHPH